MSYLYDATTGEYLGRATDKQDTVSVIRFGDGADRFGRPFLIYWAPGSRVHGYVLPDGALRSPPTRARKVCILATPPERDRAAELVRAGDHGSHAEGGVNIDVEGNAVGLWFEPDIVEMDEHAYVSLTRDEMEKLAWKILEAVRG